MAIITMDQITIGAKVEVRRRNAEQGLAAAACSWHCATVIACGPDCRTVKYDHLLDGIITDTIHVDHSLNYGCLIRPIPCTVEVSLCYGLCVDAFVNNAWYEGVVFDCENGVSERLVFFPDMDDVHMMKTDELRVTQDWYGVDGIWKVRGNWVLLELMEEYETELPNVVSVRQIWYDLKQKEGFRNKIKEWTCDDKSMWVGLLRECVLRNFDTSAEYVLNVLVGDLADELIEKPRSGRNKNCEGVLEDGEERNQVASSLYVEPVGNSSEAEADEEYYPISFKRRRRKINASVHVVTDDPVKDSGPVRKPGWRPFHEAKFCPGALENYLMAGKMRSQLKKQNDGGTGLHELLSEARMHLCYIGWKIEYGGDKRGRVMFRYIPPKGRVLYSLRDACQAIHQQVPLSSKLEPKYCPQSLRDYLAVYRSKENESNDVGCLRRKAKEHLLAVGWTVSPGYVSLTSKELRYVSPSKKAYRSLLTACRVQCNEEFYKTKEVANSTSSSSHDKLSSYIHEKRRSKRPKRQRSSSFPRSGSKMCGERKIMKASRLQLDTECKPRVLHSSKRVRQVVVPSSAHRIPRTVLSWLIEHNVVMPREKVCYLSIIDGSIIGEGEINCSGITCNCCEDVFGMYNFGRHVGSYHTQPSARIFLRDGRSLFDCQNQLLKNQLNCIAVEPRKRIKRDLGDRMNDDICSVCHYGGTLVLCDRCPSSFHLNCLGIEDLPDGNWFCPSCQCGICGQSEIGGDSIGGDSVQLIEKEVVRCDQCNRAYHVECVRKIGLGKLDLNPNSSWFCGIRCEKLSASLHKLLGKSVAVGVDSLSWTILRPRKDVCDSFDPSDTETDTELQSKLNVALGVMHECFEPIKDPYTNSDLAEDILFNNTSELNRLNCWGFYTVLLEREEEVISVATVRIHDAKVAEVPLVGTCVQYRRQGMCRILFDVLEDKFRELEVERLILPAVPEVLQTWTTSFGFTTMSDSERFEFLPYTFLDFQDTTMCQKFLRASPVAEPTTEPRSNRPKRIIKYKQRNENTDTDRNIIIPALIQAEQVEWSRDAKQQQVEVGVENVSDSVATDPPVDTTTTTLQDEAELNWHSSEPFIFQECLMNASYDKLRDYQWSREKSALAAYEENQQEKS